MITDRVELLAIECAMLDAQNKILQARIASLEQQFEMRMHVLEIALARASHVVDETPETRPRRIVDDRGHVIMLRESAA